MQASRETENGWRIWRLVMQPVLSIRSWRRAAGGRPGSKSGSERKGRRRQQREERSS